MDLLKKAYKFEEPIKKKGKSKTYKYNYSTTMMDLMTEANNSTNPSLKKKVQPHAKHTNITTRTHSTVKFNILQNHKANNMNLTPFSLY